MVIATPAIAAASERHARWDASSASTPSQDTAYPA